MESKVSEQTLELGKRGCHAKENRRIVNKFQQTA